MEERCSDRFYDLCLTPTTDVSTHDTSLEACKLACELEQVLGFCDWFIYTPNEFQSCRMYTNDYHGTLEHALDDACFRQGGPTCATDVTTVSCPDRCSYGCHGCGNGNTNDECDFIHDLGCVMDTPPTDFPTGAQDFQSCKEACAAQNSFAIWDEINGVVPCICYNDGQRHCNAYAVKLAIPAGGSIDTCLSHSVEGTLF